MGGQFVLLDFPVEIICHILSFVSYKDLIRSTSTCKFIRNTVQKSAFLSYAIDLAYHQLQATETSTIPYAARKQRLLKSQNRWNKLEWAAKHKVECPHTAYMYDFVNGIYAIGQNAANDRRFSENVTFYRLPPYPTPPDSKEDGAGSTNASSMNGANDIPRGNSNRDSWTYAFGMTILDFTMDPEQDLLVLLALAPPESQYFCHIHLRTLSTNETHPQAGSHFLPFLRKSQVTGGIDHVPAYRLRILDDLVGTLAKEVVDDVDGYSAFMEIWNWKHGARGSIFMSSKRCAIRPNGIEDFCFLSKTAFLVAEQMGAFEVFTFTDPADPSAYSRPTLRSTFMLPKLKPTQLFWYLTINCNPSPGSVPLFPPRNAQLSPFPRTVRDHHINPEERILGCAIGTVNPENHQGDGAPHTFDCFIFFIHAKVFLDSIDESRVSGFHLLSSRQASQTPRSISTSTDSELNDGTVRPEDSLAWVDQILNLPEDDDVPAPQPIAQARTETSSEGTSTWKAVGRYEWHEWGPENTRWFQDLLSTNWQHAIHGLRTVECVPVGERNVDVHAHAHQHWEHTTETHKLRIRDFNPNVARGAIITERDRKDEDKNRWKIVVTKNSVANTKNVFEEEIWSALPYREVVTEETVQVAEVMMDESRILLIKDGTLKGIDVLEF
ncbi:hypothetical protein BDM02DRAFT_3183732 [Thelephora ganbajun]|uniref:Uncharacterized protein n=1 Tax=Thelephora ganbajun TaxID=370292 RepID=A0ACB6ZRQ4_THEGA|nr:hypothetical protein BDM02DRAFT_3183732 [Thelephora ganbajun]